MSKYILHIETEPMPIAEILVNAPEFKAASNIKDPAKIIEDIEKKKQKYVDEAQFNESASKVCAAAITNYDTGEQKIISIYGGDYENISTEEDILNKLVEIFKSAFEVETITFRGFKFVYPFLARRAAVYGINMFKLFYNEYYPGKLDEDRHIDLAKIWACGSISHPESIKEVAGVLKLHMSLSNVPYYKLVKINEENKIDEEEANAFLLNTLDVLEEIAGRIYYARKS